MRYPTFVRQNSRYRGPIEADKFNGQSSSIEHDMNYLYEKIDSIKADTVDMLEDCYGEAETRRTNIMYLNAENQYLKGGECRV